MTLGRFPARHLFVGRADVPPGRPVGFRRHLRLCPVNGSLAEDLRYQRDVALLCRR